MFRRKWSRNRVIFELHEQGMSLRDLSVKAGLSPSTLKNALRMRYPKGQTIIAEALGRRREEIWRD